LIGVVERILEIRPRSFVYLFSGGKDSALALLRTRDVVKDLASRLKARVYVVYIYITGNTHPLNTYAALSVMFWHKKHYGFQPVFLVNMDKIFQEYVEKYGLQVGPQRWCYIEFKNKMIARFERTIPRPVVEIDGMKPSDSKAREQKLKSEFEEVVRKHNGFKYYSWHPLFSFNGDPLEELRKYPEFKPIVRLYEVYGDSLNCVLCPYRSRGRYQRIHGIEDLTVIDYFLKQTTRSRTWHRLLSFTQQQQLEVTE